MIQLQDLKGKTFKLKKKKSQGFIPLGPQEFNNSNFLCVNEYSSSLGHGEQVLCWSYVKIC